MWLLRALPIFRLQKVGLSIKLECLQWEGHEFGSKKL